MNSQVASNKILIDLLIEHLVKHGYDYNLTKLVECGVIEDFELSHLEEQVKKKNLAAIIHRVLQVILKEKDNRDYMSANCFRDLYDCHVCVFHVAQIYTKGILEGRTPHIFGMDDVITTAELMLTFQKVFDLNRRIDRISVKNCISYIRKSDNLFLDENSLIVDVRDKEVHDKDIRYTDSVCIPIDEININPSIVLKKLNEAGKTNIILYCSRGYLSSMAGDILIKNGFTNVYVLKASEG